MSEGNGGADFSIDLPLREVLQRVDRYMLDWGFSIGLNRTAGTAEYSVVRRKRFPLRLLARAPDFYRVRLSIREEGEGRTYLTVKTSQRGRWPQDVRHEIERWIVDELGGTPILTTVTTKASETNHSRIHSLARRTIPLSPTIPVRFLRREESEKRPAS